MSGILLACAPFEIFYTIVELVTVLMVYFFQAVRIRDISQSDKPMHLSYHPVASIADKRNVGIPVYIDTGFAPLSLVVDIESLS